MASAKTRWEGPDDTVTALFASWKTDMLVIYVCLNEVPHYEVRSPAFSTALARLWLEVGARNLDHDVFAGAAGLVDLLSGKCQRISLEVEAMATLLGPRRTHSPQLQRRLSHTVGRPGGVYAENAELMAVYHAALTSLVSCSQLSIVF